MKIENPNSIIFLFLGLIFPASLNSQTNQIIDCNSLNEFENIRIFQNNKDLYISLEDNIYRWNVNGIKAALDSITKYADTEYFLTLFILIKDIPRLIIKTPVSYWLNYSKGEITFPEISERFKVDYISGDEWNKLKHFTPQGASFNKIDLVFYPQLTLQNTLLGQIYEIQLNIAPALEVSLWKGMLFTGQVIFPIINDLSYEGDFIRPGFVTLAQEFRLPHNWFGRVAFGNFNANRYGADVTVSHPLNSLWKFGFNAGITGSSYFYDGRWITGELNTLTWFTKIQYFWPRFNLQFDVSYGRYLNHDYGFRADCTRHFGETTIGFYAMFTGGETNGGFHFSAPLPLRKYKKRRTLRLVPPRYFDWEYNAGTEFYYGRYYETRPNENRSEHWLNPEFIKNYLLNTTK